MMKSLLILILVGVVVALTSLFFGRSASFQDVEIAKIPGISEDLVSAEGNVFSTVSPFQYNRIQKLIAIDIEVSVKGKKRRLTDIVSVEQLNGLLAELRFLEKNKNLIGAFDASRGFFEGAKNLVTGIMDLVKNPKESFNSLKGAAAEFYKYANSSPDFMSDLKEFASASYEGYAFDLGRENGVDLYLTILPETSEAIYHKTNARLSGMAAFELATAYISWAKVSKVASASKSGKLFGNSALKGGAKLSAFGKRMTKGQNTIKKVAAAKTKILQTSTTAIRSLADPVKLATLTSSRAVNRRINKLMFHMHEARRAGMTPDVFIKMSMADHQIGRVAQEFYHHPDVFSRQTLENFNKLDELGVFKHRKNLKSLKLGKNPVVIEGKYAGQSLDVDHIIPVKHAPELENNFSNLRYLPSAENRSRGAVWDSAAHHHADLFKKHFKWEPNPLELVTN